MIPKYIPNISTHILHSSGFAHTLHYYHSLRFSGINTLSKSHSLCNSMSCCLLCFDWMKPASIYRSSKRCKQPKNIRCINYVSKLGSRIHKILQLFRLLHATNLSTLISFPCFQLCVYLCLSLHWMRCLKKFSFFDFQFISWTSHDGDRWSQYLKFSLSTLNHEWTIFLLHI